MILAELAAILSSESFSSSKRCRDFLEFVVKRTLAGDHESLTERFLGVELFGRSVDYETATDAVVRVRANDVRRRLAQYYSTRKTGPIRIELIAGGYIPEFHRTQQEPGHSPEKPVVVSPVTMLSGSAVTVTPVAALAVDNPDKPAPGSTAYRRHRSLLALCSIGAAVIAVTALIVLLKHRATNFDHFWAPVLNASSAPVLNLPTSDTYQLEPGAMLRFHQISPGQSITLAPGDIQSFHNWHVSLPVLQATLSVARALEQKGVIPLIRIGTDMRRDEVEGHPIIAIGSFSNPWTEQNVSGLRFTFDRGASDNQAPQIRDSLNPQRVWALSHLYPDPQTKDYAIVTRTFDPVTHEPFVSLAGLHSFGNQIAGDFVSQKSSWDTIAAKAPHGWEKMNLQIVLEADIVGTTAGSPRILDVYFWK